MLEKKPNETLGEYIVRLRKSRGYSQRKLAQVTGVSNTTISRIEKGETEKPDVDTLKLIASHLNIDEIYILKAAGYIEEKGSNILREPTAAYEVLTQKEEKDIAKRIEKLKSEILENQEGLMFDGNPASPEAIESVLAALEFGMKQATIHNKKFVPKKFRK